MKKMFMVLLAFFLVSGITFAQADFSANTEDTTQEYRGIIPHPKPQGYTCDSAYEAAYELIYDKKSEKYITGIKEDQLKESLKTMDLGTKIMGGCVQLSDLPRLIVYLIDLCTKLAGTIAVGFIIYAGFQLIVSGVTEDRESAKNTIKYAIIGLIVCLLAWVIVNVIQVQLTA